MRGAQERIQVPGGHSFRVLRWQRNLREVESLLGPDRAEPVTGEGAHWHFHREMELTLFTRGGGTRFVGDHIGLFGAGDLVLLGENLPHYWHTREASSGVSVQWHFPASHGFWAFPENLEFARLFAAAGRGMRLSGETARRVSAVLLELPASLGHARLAGLLTALSRMASAPAKDCSVLSSRDFHLSSESAYQSAISRAVQHLVANFRESVRLEDVLAVSGLSRPTFARQFKQHAGRSFSEFLNRLRLQAACRDLRESERGVLEIALGSGFSQIAFFNRLFRRELRCSPSEYRRRERGKRGASA